MTESDPAAEEQIWILQALQGNQQAFGQLVTRYQRPVYNLAYRMLGNAQDAEDASQEAFLRAYRALSSFKIGRKFSSWLLSIASNLCIDILRRRRYIWLSLEDVSFRLSASTEDPGHNVLRQEHADQVQLLLGQIPEKYRLVVVLRYWYDLSYKEIAETTGLSLNTVKTRLHRARHMLARAMEETDLCDAASQTG
ncbi:MAG: sigma-70 family RNA polymerase sigma factor [Chloroflexia bacterium]|nr:sigma-70 family RNA polymerase sigma factor [Chloroflexia bacterium]